MTELKQLPTFLAKFADTWWAWVVMASGGVAQYFWPTEALQKMAVGAGVLFLCDWLTGVLAAWVRKELSSTGARRVLVKFLGYSVYMTVAGVVPLFVTHEFFEPYGYVPMSMVLGGIAYTELVSVFENLKKMEVVLDSRFLAWLGPVLDRLKPPERAEALHSQRRQEYDDPGALRITDDVAEETQ